MSYYVYILANKPNGTLYIGCTSNLIKRIWEHKRKCVKSFTSKYNIDKLVYFEEHATAHEMMRRERRLKKWCRTWKTEMITKENPLWLDLYESICK